MRCRRSRVTFFLQVRTSKTYSADRVQMANATGNISTSRGLFSSFSAPCPDAVDGQVDGWDAESYHAALHNWMRYSFIIRDVRVFESALTSSFRLIDSEKKASENNEEQRRPRIMLALQQCVMSMQVPVLFKLLTGCCSHAIIALFCCLVSSGIVYSWERKQRHESSCCVAARRSHHCTALPCTATDVRDTETPVHI